MRTKELSVHHWIAPEILYVMTKSAFRENVHYLMRYDFGLPAGEQRTAFEKFENKQDAEAALSAWASSERRNRGYT